MATVLIRKKLKADHAGRYPKSSIGGIGSNHQLFL